MTGEFQERLVVASSFAPTDSNGRAREAGESHRLRLRARPPCRLPGLGSCRRARQFQGIQRQGLECASSPVGNFAFAGSQGSGAETRASARECAVIARDGEAQPQGHAEASGVPSGTQSRPASSAASVSKSTPQTARSRPVQSSKTWWTARGSTPARSPRSPAGRTATRTRRAAAFYFSRAASWRVFCTGDSRYSRTVRSPRLISAETCIPGAKSRDAPSTATDWVSSTTMAR